MSQERRSNEVFQGNALKQSAIPSKNVMEEDFGWEVPIETVPLPSEGKVYPSNSPLSNMSSIDIKAMTAKEEDILTSRALIKKGTVITHLLQSCVVGGGVNVKEMLVGDRNALMVAVRITGYGSAYSADVSCPACSAQLKESFDLGELSIKRLNIDPVTPGENRFSFLLPITKKEVHFKFLTGVDEEELNLIAERKKKMLPDMATESLVTSRLARSIVSVGGIEDQNKINQFVERMPAQDSRKLRAYIDQNEPGINMDVWLHCSQCGESSEVGLPMGAEFFWPRD